MKTRQIVKKNELWSLIKRLGKIYGEDEHFITEYAQDVYHAHSHEIDNAIKLFKNLIEVAQILGIDTESKEKEVAVTHDFTRYCDNKSKSCIKNARKTKIKAP